MKNVESKQIGQLLQIIQNNPGGRLVHFSKEAHILTEKLQHICLPYQNDLYLYCTNEAYYDDALKRYAKTPHMHIVKFNLERPRYFIQGITYDYLISTLDFQGVDRRAFLKKCYPIIRTGGTIILLIPKTSYTKRNEWKTILEEEYYVAINSIDDLFTDHDVIVAKRMHGWGNT